MTSRRGSRSFSLATPISSRRSPSSVRRGGAGRLGGESESQGGAARAIEGGFFQGAIARSAYEQQRGVESGERVVVGVNEYLVEEPVPSVPAPDYTALAAGQRARLAQLRA